MADNNNNQNTGTPEQLQAEVAQLRAELTQAREEIKGKNIAYDRAKKERDDLAKWKNDSMQEMHQHPALFQNVFSKMTQGVPFEQAREQAIAEYTGDKPATRNGGNSPAPSGDGDEEIPAYVKKLQEKLDGVEKENRLLKIGYQKLSKQSEDTTTRQIKGEEARMRHLLRTQIDEKMKDFRFVDDKQRAKFYGDVWNDMTAEVEEGAERPKLDDVVASHRKYFAQADESAEEKAARERADRIKELNTAIGSPDGGGGGGGEPEQDSGPLTYDKLEERQAKRKERLLTLHNHADAGMDQVPVS